jgi:hypothetical protein
MFSGDIHDMTKREWVFTLGGGFLTLSVHLHDGCALVRGVYFGQDARFPSE